MSQNQLDTTESYEDAYEVAQALKAVDGITEVRASSRQITVAFAADNPHFRHDDIPEESIEEMMSIIDDAGFRYEYTDSTPFVGMEKHTSFGSRSHDRITDPSYACEFQATFVNENGYF